MGLLPTAAVLTVASGEMQSCLERSCSQALAPPGSSSLRMEEGSAVRASHSTAGSGDRGWVF